MSTNFNTCRFLKVFFCPPLIILFGLDIAGVVLHIILNGKDSIFNNLFKIWVQRGPNVRVTLVI